MKNETILYFCNSYLLMLNFYESLEEVISDYYGKEPEENLERLKEECINILNLEPEEKKKEIKQIISNIKYLDIKHDEMEDVLKTIVLKI